MFSRIVDIEDSSQIKRVLYDPETRQMSVVFTRGENYVYEKVPPSVFGELISNESVGGFFSQYVRTTFDYRKMKT